VWIVNSGGRKKIGDIAGSSSHHSGYIYITLSGTTYGAHRLAWLYVHGVMPPDEIDHINRVKNDNRLANLRSVSHQENHHNRSLQANNKSGCSGVIWVKKSQKWSATIKMANKRIHLGEQTHLNDAIKLRKDAELKYNYHVNHGGCTKNVQ